MDRTGVHTCSHTWAPSFHLGHEDTRSRRGNVSITHGPFGGDGHLQNANLKMQGSRITGNVGDPRQGTGTPQHSSGGQDTVPAALVTRQAQKTRSPSPNAFQENQASGFHNLVA